MSYELRILRSAQKQLAKIPRNDRERIIAAVRDLADEPRPAGVRKLSGRSGYRIRVGVYRVIYEIHDAQLQVVVVAVGHRGGVYG